uniref:Inner centromere protein-like n=1 Tax=Phallusia mammillata TaxID=59560 RepID=A0A6F9DFT4_9ASCI|nr:inner centromere protein-like [Phallusia mammillata]
MISFKQLLFPLWEEPNFGYLPLISSTFRNSDSELHTFKSDQLGWKDVNVAKGIWKKKENLGEDIKVYIENCYEKMKESILECRNGEMSSTPIIPKTPHVKSKTRSRRGITKKRSSVGQTVRRSSRRLKQSLAVAGVINMDRLSIATQVGNVLQSTIESTPAKGKTGRKKKNQATLEPVPQKSISPVVELTDCKAFIKPTPKTKVTRKASIRGKRNVLLHEDGTFDVVPTLEHKKSLRKSKKSQATKPPASPEQPKPITPEPKTVTKKMSPLKEDNSNSLELDTKSSTPTQEDVAMETADVIVVEAPLVEETEELDQVKSINSTDTDNDEDANTTSSSVCSSSAATVDLEDHRPTDTMMNPTIELEQMDTSAMIFAVPDSDEEETEHVHVEHKVMEIKVIEEDIPKSSRRSTRNSRRSSKVLGGFAAKRRSTRQSLRNKTLQIAQADEQVQPTPLVEEVDTESETVEESEENHVEENLHDEQLDKENDEPPRSTTRPRPKIAKAIVRPKVKKHPPSARSSSMKRTHAKIGAASNNSLMKTPSPPKQKKIEWNTPGMSKSLRSKRAKTTYSTGKHNRSTEASRAKRTPVRASPANVRYGTALSHAQFTNINNTLKSFILRNTPEKVNKEAELEAKKKMLEEKTRKEEERQKQMEEHKQAKLLEQKRKREERAKRANQLREERERAEREKQDQLQDRWKQKIADADRCKNLRKVEEVAKMQSKMEKLAKAEARRKEEESEKLVRLKEQEEEREKRLKQHQKEKKLLEELRLKEKIDKWTFMLTRRQEEKREEQRRLEEERIQQQKLEEQRLAEEEEKLRRKREQEEHERARRKRELEAATEVAAKKKKQEEMKKLTEQREEARKEREAARQRRMEEKRLAKEEEKRQKEEQKRIKEAEKRAREEEKRIREEQLMQQQEKERREEAQQIAQEKLEAEKEARRQAARQKKELLRQKIEAERRLREEEEKQKRIREEQERRRIMQHEKAEMERKIKEAEKAKQMQLNSTYTATAHSSVLEDSHNNYNMTPRGPDRPLLPSTTTDYVIADLKSDDSTDNEDEPKKPIPTWAKSSALNLALIQQHHNDLSSADEVFKGLLQPVSLSDLFPNKIKARYFKRTSSAHWTSPIRPPGYTSFTSQCKGF